MQSNRWRARFLSETLALQAKSGANIFAISRFIPEITEKFDGSTSLEIRASSKDVQRYLDGRMFQLPGIVGRNSELQEEIKTTIVKAVGGMYVASSRGSETCANMFLGFSLLSSTWIP